MNTPTAPPPFSKRRANLPLNELLWRRQLVQWSGGLLVLALVLPVFWLSWLTRNNYWVLKDVADSPQQSGYAVVENAGTWSSKSDSYFGFTFLLEGQKVTQEVFNKQKWARTQVGSTVRVVYRVGKSGKIWVDDWQPVAQKAAVNR